MVGISTDPWTVVANIATVIAVIGGFLWWGIRLLLRRLDHIDTCLDRAQAAAVQAAENVRVQTLDSVRQVKDDLVGEEGRTRNELHDHIGIVLPHLSRIDKTMAWMAGKMGWSPDFGPGGDETGITNF